ncbi:hypothetical protein [Synechococcus sp. 8F6]|uniref:hypothetical protein n=1 Tax=Synechococcus sp. 8F6 TaxID=2025606 RepID=UPI00117F29F3|nr:hypothetical protein [Synechococcus sp. 8F6]
MSSNQPSPQPAAHALFTGRWSGILLTAAVILIVWPALGKALPQEVDLKRDHQETSKQLMERSAECSRLEREFNQYDLYRSANSSKMYGVDIIGRVWTMMRQAGRGCSLQTQYRLNRPDYEIDYLGKRIWSTFHYEDKQLCLYTRQPRSKTSKRCFQPVGLVSKLAPYFLN